MISVKDIAFSYPRSEEILHKISFDLEAGHCLALLGNNGAGKSTLIKCLNRIHNPKSGRIVVAEQDVQKMRRVDIAKTMAYVAQQSEGEQLTVFDAVLLTLSQLHLLVFSLFLYFPVLHFFQVLFLLFFPF